MGIFELLYFLAYTAKKKYVLRHQKRLPYPVISVGNITVGGTGKTPATIAAAREALRRGFSPVVLTRGYRGRAKGPCFVDISVPRASSLYGDEPVLMAEKLTDVPVVKCADRYAGGMFAVNQLTPQTASRKFRFANHGLHPLFILDDGFQHWKLFRNRDILLIDAENPFGNGQLLPGGKLREPLQEIARAHCIVITRSDTQADKSCRALTDEIRRFNAVSPLFLSRHIPVALKNPAGKTMPVEAAEGRRVFGFCALGNPRSFSSTIESLGCKVLGMRSFRDHSAYRQKDIDRIAREAKQAGADWIVTTEKDIIKTKHLDLPENAFIVEIAFSAEGNFFDEAFRF